MSAEPRNVDRWLLASSNPELIACWREDPVLFGWDVFRFVPDRYQGEALWAMACEPKVALPAAKGAGKTTLLSIAIWWRLTCWPQVKGAATSVSGANLRDNLRSELELWYARGDLVRALFEITSDGIRSKESPRTWFLSFRTWPTSAQETQLGETLAGIHADHTLFVVDEAGAVPEAIGRAAEGALANADAAEGRTACYWIAGNTTNRDSLLGRVVLRRSDRWWMLHVTGDPSDPMRAPRISLAWARDQIEQYGESDPFVQINVFAKFPDTAVNALIGDEDVAAAQKRFYREDEYASAARVMGVDVALEGDDRCVIQRRQGLVAFSPTVVRNRTTSVLTALIAAEMIDFKVDTCFIDVTGGFGAAIADGLEAIGHFAVRVNFGGASTRKDCVNKRTEMYVETANWLKNGGRLPESPLYLELAATQYGINPSGKLVLEPKLAVKKRLGQSPDVADALALTFAQPVSPLSIRRMAEMRRPALDYNPIERPFGRDDSDYNPIERSYGGA